MASSITFASAMDGVVPLLSCAPLATEAVTPSGTSQQSVEAPQKCAVRMTFEVDVWVTVGQNPTAEAGSGWLVRASQIADFGRVEQGYKVAYITA